MINSLLHMILDWSKFKAFADDKISVTVKFKYVLGRAGYYGGNKKMLVTGIFSFSHVFKRLV